MNLMPQVTNHMWNLVPYDRFQNLVNYIWVFKVKENFDGAVKHFKAPLVTKGLKQEARPNYDKRFQPPSFPHPKFPNYRCHLQIAIYGLKQAPHGWFHRFNSYLLFLSFKVRKANPSLFIYASSQGGRYLLLLLLISLSPLIPFSITIFYYLTLIGTCHE